jgi:hypothetical protein
MLHPPLGETYVKVEGLVVFLIFLYWHSVAHSMYKEYSRASSMELHHMLGVYGT